MATRRRLRRARRWYNREVRRLTACFPTDAGREPATAVRECWPFDPADYTPGFLRASFTGRDIGGAFGRRQTFHGCGCDACESGRCCGWASW